jgi:hypothetical protein
MKTESPSPINQVRVDSLPLENKGAVESIVNPIFSSIGKFIVFPLRYLGSKTWSIPGIIVRTPVIIFMAIFYNKPITKDQFFGTGYAENSTKLESEESKEYLRYACFGLVPFRYEEDKWSNPFNGKIVAPKELECRAMWKREKKVSLIQVIYLKLLFLRMRANLLFPLALCTPIGMMGLKILKVVFINL